MMRKFVLAAVLVLMAGSAQAATLDVVGGQLMGASGVDVGGLLYDVEFVDGTCIALFSGCDESSDFVFTGYNGAANASQALFDQVFLDGPEGFFDTIPSLISGCFSGVLCEVMTPTGVHSPGRFDHNDATNLAMSNSDQVRYDAWAWSSGTPTSGTYSPDIHVFARWSPADPVPEPSTALLLSLGLTGLAARRRSLRS
jgi:hypothetical protein